MNRSALDRIWAKFKALIWADSINSIPYSNPIHRLVRWSKRCTFHLSWIITFAFPFASYLKNHSTDQRIAFYRIQPSKRRESNSRDNNDTEIQRWFGTVSSVPCFWTFIVDFVFPVDSSQKKNREKKLIQFQNIYLTNFVCFFFFLSFFLLYPLLKIHSRRIWIAIWRCTNEIKKNNCACVCILYSVYPHWCDGHQPKKKISLKMHQTLCVNKLLCAVLVYRVLTAKSRNHYELNGYTIAAVEIVPVAYQRIPWMRPN